MRPYCERLSGRSGLSDKFRPERGGRSLGGRSCTYRGGRVEAPIQSCCRLDGWLYYAAHPVARRGGRFGGVHRRVRPAGDGEKLAFSNGAVEFAVSRGARLRYAHQNWERQRLVTFNTTRLDRKRTPRPGLVVSLAQPPHERRGWLNETGRLEMIL